jgi:hypothetical protein
MVAFGHEGHGVAVPCFTLLCLRELSKVPASPLEPISHRFLGVSWQKRCNRAMPRNFQHANDETVIEPTAVDAPISLACGLPMSIRDERSLPPQTSTERSSLIDNN